MIQDSESKIIEGSPTKELFIHMLVRDIPLIRAIIDLIDNSVDGALRSQENDNFKNFWIRIEIKKDHFMIIDNCGGITVDIARNYAFRFGRPEGIPLTPGSIGKFGVGMKRTFFKLGRFFSIESTTENSYFSVEQDVDEWEKKPTDWNFTFSKLEEGSIKRNKDSIGTKIIIKSLYENISEEFDNDNFIALLKKEIETAHSIVINKGLAITLNEIPLGYRTLTFLNSDQLTPAYKEICINKESSPIKVKIYAGVSERNINEGGWYVFCNGRMVLESDQSVITGWGRDGIPKYHPNYAFFRGFVFFDSDDAELLPWTTTKTGIDTDSASFKAILMEMNGLMRPVIDFLKKLENERAGEKSGELDDIPLGNVINDTSPINYSDINKENIFVIPKLENKPKGPKMGRIQYNKPKDEIDKIQKVLKANSNKSVGEKTFEYFLNMECDG